MEKAVIILSGGMDSTTLLYDVLNQGYEVYALSFDYNQKHKKELEMARKTCEKLKINHKIIDISSISEFLGESSLVGKEVEVPEGHYEEESMKSTIVPNRNMILLSFAISYAISIKSDNVFYGAHSGDHAIYPDCRPEFVEAMKNLAKVCDYEKINIYAPYLYLDKAGIVEKGNKLNVDYSLTWTCYKGLEKACGKCGSCVERLEAFRKTGKEDKIEYENRDS